MAKIDKLKCEGGKFKSCYRHTMIAKIPSLTYLDDRPVFPDEHEVVQAWARDGLDGERAAREQIAERKKQREARNYQFMQAIRAEAFREVCPCNSCCHATIIATMSCLQLLGATLVP